MFSSRCYKGKRENIKYSGLEISGYKVTGYKSMKNLENRAKSKKIHVTLKNEKVTGGYNIQGAVYSCAVTQ